MIDVPTGYTFEAKITKSEGQINFAPAQAIINSKIYPDFDYNSTFELPHRIWYLFSDVSEKLVNTLI